MALKIGDQAPDFELPSTSGEIFQLSALTESSIIYFYPKDFTAVCTKEACSFRDNFSFFKELDINIIGISTDTIAKHKKFKEDHNLPFELLADVSGAVCKKYDALIPFVKLPKRITYLIDVNQKIRGVYNDLFGHDSHIKKMIELVQQELQK